MTLMTRAPAWSGRQVAYGPEAELYDHRTSAYQACRDLIVDALPLAPGDRVLDVGCGTGLCFERIQRAIGPTGAVVGIDESAEMTALAVARVESYGWKNVTLLAAPADVARIDGLADAALFCATHDVLQSPDAVRHIVDRLRPGAWIAAGGGKFADPMLVALNLQVRAIHRPFVRSFQGFDRPWTHLEPFVQSLRVEEFAFGTGYYAVGQLPG